MLPKKISLKIAIQMDPIETVNIDSDTSFALALEAQRRGHQLHHYLPQDLSYDQGRIMATARSLAVARVPKGGHYTLGTAESVDLSKMDVVLMRQDPPFDMSYITATHLLEQLHPKTLIVNDPASVRNAPEKFFVTRFADLIPATLITRDPSQIARFRADHTDIIVKPLYGNGGVGVFHIRPEDENLNALIEMFQAQFREPFIVQQYLPQIRTGDKRIILIDGKPSGALNRIPPQGEARANMHAGADPLPVELTQRDLEICQIIGPVLREAGLIFVGIDVIGGFLTEINVTSPTGIQEIDRFNNVNLAADLWDVIEAKRA